MPYHLKIKSSKALEYLLNNGVVYYIDRLVRKKGIVVLKNYNNEDIGKVFIELVGKIKMKNRIPKVITEHNEIPLSHFIEHSGYHLLTEWVSDIKTIFQVKTLGGLRLYKIYLFNKEDI